jgi:hypothetical protein
MNKKCALIKCLLDGEVINVSNSIHKVGYSNPARELPREVEKPFGVKVERIKKEGKDRYGNYVTWNEYRLFKTPRNSDGIQKMRLYLAENMGEYRPKEKQPKEVKPDLFSELT